MTGSLRGAGSRESLSSKHDADALAFWQGAWQHYKGTPAGAGEVAAYILGNTGLWGQDLNAVSGLNEKLGVYLQDIVTVGMAAALEKVLAEGERT